MDKERLREHISFMKAVEKLPHTGKTKETLDRHKRFVRSELREGCDPIRYSLREHFFSELDVVLPPSAVWRVHYTDFDSWKLYAIFYDGGETDEEIDEILEGQRVEIHSAFDCTGKPFTHYIRWKRTPAGIAVIHSMGLDV